MYNDGENSYRNNDLLLVNRLFYMVIYDTKDHAIFVFQENALTFILHLSVLLLLLKQFYDTKADKSTTLAVISSCFDRRARPCGNDINVCKLDIFRDRRTLFKTRRIMTSATL